LTSSGIKDAIIAYNSTWSLPLVNTNDFTNIFGKTYDVAVTPSLLPIFKFLIQ